MRKLNITVAALLTLAAIALDIFALTSRCTASPKVNVSILLFALVVQVLAVGFPIVIGDVFLGDLPKRGLAVIGMALLLFVAGSLAFRYAALLSDAIGQPKTFKSAGFFTRGGPACRNAG